MNVQLVCLHTTKYERVQSYIRRSAFEHINYSNVVGSNQLLLIRTPVNMVSGQLMTQARGKNDFVSNVTRVYSNINRKWLS
jgi:hypothetical protein